jgi:NAD(P)-dependent dehydrogenase (short-subunit alcohol dehydrogenase family)
MDQAANLAGKIAVVTGGSSGIGQYTALALAERGANVIITARNAGRLAATAAWLRQKAPGVTVETERVDFASLPSVRDLAARILDRHPAISILVNNAGMVMARRTVTTDGFEAIFQINHLAPFLLTNLLLPAVKAAASSRIVVVASQAARRAIIDFDDLQMANGWSIMGVYGRSKLANIMFTYALARRLEGTGVTANCLHPGFVGTRIANKGGLIDLAWALVKPFVLTPAKGAETVVHEAAAPEMAGVTGQYLYLKKPILSNAISYDVAAQERLWRMSAEMTGIAP